MHDIRFRHRNLHFLLAIDGNGNHRRSGADNLADISADSRHDAVLRCLQLGIGNLVLRLFESRFSRLQL
ncbi:hypothetical protein D3C87_2136740 [compost metagenome]